MVKHVITGHLQEGRAFVGQRASLFTHGFILKRMGFVATTYLEGASTLRMHVIFNIFLFLLKNMKHLRKERRITENLRPGFVPAFGRCECNSGTLNSRVMGEMVHSILKREKGK
mmetsp:Transcript_24805/g.34507  ORF Transcript_24805/g.34507 Transcript_24805/m.34507 type:complete len:114 (-) Transcript_24805:1288-1629(-)